MKKKDSLSSEIKKAKHVAWISAFGFIGSVIAFVCMFFFPPPDFTKEIPVFSEGALIAGEISMALLIFACTVFGLKLAEEKKTLPAAGFTMMAIAQGVVFILNFMSFDSSDKLAELYKTYCGSIYLLLPAMILIAFYSDFPKIINALGIISCIPQVWVYLHFMHSKKYEPILDQVSFFSMIIANIAALGWGIYILKNLKDEIVEINNVHGLKD